MRVLVLMAASCAIGCALQAPLPQPGSEQERREPDAPPGLRVATWNLTWFQEPSRPPDDATQRDGVELALGALGLDLVGLQEIASVSGFAQLRERLGFYGGVLGERSVPQRLALLYRLSRFELLETSELSGLDDAGRPPLVVRLFDLAREEILCVIVVHAKANAEPASYRTRQRFAEGLAERVVALRAELTGEGGTLLVLGDFNDGLERSITPGLASPYAPLLGELAAPTRVLELRREASTIWGGTVDHVLVDRALEERIVPRSEAVLRDALQGLLSAPAETLSDHFPVQLELR